MKLKHILLTLVLVLTTVAATAQALKPATAAQQRDMTARINKVASTTQSITCNFTQVKTMSFLNEKLTSTGRMFYDNKTKLYNMVDSNCFLGHMPLLKQMPTESGV